MKKINLIMSIFTCLIFSNLVNAQKLKPTPDPDLKPIADAVLTVKGKDFPKIKLADGIKKSNSQMQSCCTIGDTRNIVAQDVYDERAGVYPEGKVTLQTTHVYSPPMTCWVISSYSWQETSKRKASRVLSAVPGNYSFVTSSQYNQTYNELKDFVLKLDILGKYKADIIAKLNLFTQNYADYAYSINSSHGTVTLDVTLTSAGKFNGRSWLEGKIMTTETCCPPEIRDASLLKTVLTDWVTNTVNSLPNKGKGTKVSTGNTTLPSSSTINEKIIISPIATPTPK
jgi:hypothetical protein